MRLLRMPGRFANVARRCRPTTRHVGWSLLAVTRLAVGVSLMGLAMAQVINARLGILPLDVLHVALSRRLGWTIGGAFLAVQAVLLIAYAPLRIRPGAGTVATATVPALVCDLALSLSTPPSALGWRLLLLIVGGGLFAIGVALYLGSGLGALPRDGLMLELHRRRPWMRPAVIRLVVDTACLLAGWALLGPLAAVRDGTVGPGSILLVGLLGPAIAVLLRRTRGTAAEAIPEQALATEPALPQTPHPTDGDVHRLAVPACAPDPTGPLKR